MSGPIAWLTVRQLLGARRTIALGAVTLLPLLLSIVYRAGAFELSPGEWLANHLYQLVVGTLLPLAALVFATAALGQEFEDGTAVYLLSKPVSRRAILLPKLAVSAAATAVLILVATVVPGLVAGWGNRDAEVIVGAFAIASVLGAVVYCCLFMLLSVLTGRAFIFGLLYVFLWEQLVTRLFVGTRILSVRQYTYGLADGLADVSDKVFHAPLDPWRAAIMMAAVGALATVLAIRRLRSWEIGETA